MESSPHIVTEPISAHENSQQHVQSTPTPAITLSSLQHAFQSLSSRGSGNLVVSLSQQLGSAAPSAQAGGQAATETQQSHYGEDQVTSILRNISNLTHTAAASNPPGMARQPSSDPTPAAAAPTAAATADDTPAAAAERHRLASTQSLDLQAIAKWLESMLPYILILAAVFVYHFCTGLFLFLWLLCSLVKANQLMRKLVAQKRDYHASEVVAALLYIATNVAVVAWLTSGQRLYRSFLLRPPAPPITVWQAVFMVLVADSLVRFCGLAPKLLVVAAVQSLSRPTHCSRSIHHQGRLLTLLEYLLMGYRALVPIPVWYTYLLTCTLNSVLCSLLAGFYLTFKGYGLLQQGQLVLVAAKLVMRSGALYGKYLGKADVSEACPICQEPAASAVRLECTHIFCEDCISEWLERDKTCPMCRTHIQPPGLQSFGDGATTLLPQLF